MKKLNWLAMSVALVIVSLLLLGADSKALSSLGLEELGVETSPSLVDYMIIVDPNSKEPKLVLRSALTNSSYVAVPDAATYTVLAANSGKVHIMSDLTISQTVAFPTAADGLTYEFIYAGGAEDAAWWILDTGSDTNFYVGGVTALDPDDGDVLPIYSDGNSNSILSVQGEGAGTKVKVICDGTNWFLGESILVTSVDTGATFADQ